MISRDELLAVLSYDADTGTFTRKTRTSNRIKIGDVAGSADAKGYLCIRVGGKTYKAHRLAWLYVYGEWPSGEIDHINHCPSDNRIANLRDVTKAANQQNQKREGCAYIERGMWRANIRANGKRIFLGYHPTEQAARAAYGDAKAVLHMEARK